MYSTGRDKSKEGMESLVADNPCYRLLYTPHQNRLYLGIRGYWKSKDQVPDYLTDLKKALLLLRTDFKLLLDLSTMITHPQAVLSLHVEALKLLQAAEPKKCACINPIDLIANLQVEDTLGQSHLPTRRFSSYAEAEAWLEQE